MKPDNLFSFKLFGKSLYADVIKNRWLYLAFFESVTGLTLLIYLLLGTMKLAPISFSYLFGWSFFISGILLSGFSFNLLTRKNDNYYFLLLPASNFEKLFTKVILLYVVFPPLMFLSLMFVGGAGNFLNEILFSAKAIEFNYLISKLSGFVIAYAIFSPLFVFGSIYFNELGIVKTVLSIAGILFVYTMFVLVVYNLLFWDSIDGFGFMLKRGFVFAYPTVYKALPLLQDVIDIIIFGIKYLLAPFFLVMSYLALKEKEV